MICIYYVEKPGYNEDQRGKNSKLQTEQSNIHKRQFYSRSNDTPPPSSQTTHKEKKNLPNNMTKLSTNSDESDNTIKSNDLTKIGIVSVLLILSKLCYGQWHCTGCEKTKKRARSLRVINLSCWGK